MAVASLKSSGIDADLGWLSTDTKPTTNIPNGWVGLELDTGKKYAFNAGTWYPYSAPTSITGSLANQNETLTINATVGGIALTPAKYGANTKAFITVETASIRYWIDGSTPTTIEGHLLNAGDWLELDTTDSLAKFRAIRTTDVSATIQCTYLS